MINFKLIAIIFIISFGVTWGKEPNKIINGEDTIEGEFPSQVIIYFRGQFKCTGTIIDELHIVTAGHCIFHAHQKQRPEEFTIQSGITNKSPWLALVFNVVNIHLHSNYSTNETHANDIALMTIDRNIMFNKLRQPAKLPEAETAEGVKALVSGLGKVKNSVGQRDFPYEVMKLETTVISNAQCETMLKHSILPQQLCTYRPGGYGVCSGDSGGGLLHGDQLIGIVSYGFVPCARNDGPDVYTRVHSYVSWIHEKLASEEN